MARSRTDKRRGKRRRAVHQAMVTAQDHASTPPGGNPCPGRPKSKKRPAQGRRQALLTLLPQLIIASINVNGLTPETEWAITSILEGQKYDVSTIPHFMLYPFFVVRCSA